MGLEYTYQVAISPIEQICDWNAWDYYDTFGSMVFYDCVMKID